MSEPTNEQRAEQLISDLRNIVELHEGNYDEMLAAATKALDAAEQRERLRQEDFFLSWILRAYDSLCREGWESGMTDDELRSALLDILFNYEADPGLPKNKERCAALRAMKADRHIDRQRQRKEEAR